MIKPSVKELPHLTPAELDVMNALWKTDGLSAREIHDRVTRDHEWAYSTTRTLIDRLVRKRLVDKESLHGLHVYHASISRARGLARIVRDFAQQVLESSHRPVVSLFADSGRLEPEEVEELERLLDEATRGQR